MNERATKATDYMSAAYHRMLAAEEEYKLTRGRAALQRLREAQATWERLKKLHDKAMQQERG